MTDSSPKFDPANPYRYYDESGFEGLFKVGSDGLARNDDGEVYCPAKHGTVWVVCRYATCQIPDGTVCTPEPFLNVLYQHDDGSFMAVDGLTFSPEKP